MNELENKIEQMLPSELMKVRNLIDILLKFKGNDNRTNLEYLKQSKEIHCDVDINHNVKKIVKKMVFKDIIVLIVKNVFH